MNHVVIFTVTITAAILSVVAVATAGYHLAHRSARFKDETDVTLTQIYRSHVATMEEEAAWAVSHSLPDDEWLSSVKAEAAARLRRDTLYSIAPYPLAPSYPLAYRRPSFEVAEHSTIGWVR